MKNHKLALIILISLVLIFSSFFSYIFLSKSNFAKVNVANSIPSSISTNSTNSLSSSTSTIAKETDPQIILKAKTLAQEKKFDEAMVELKKSNLDYSKNLSKEFEFFKTQSQNLVEYVGPVQHFMTHSLIVYPELAFDGDPDSVGYDEWMNTIPEFEKFLENLYKRNYILIDIHDTYEVSQNGEVIKKNLKLPSGKLPFIFSIDDVSYYDYMSGDGFASRLEVDENSNIVPIVKSLSKIDERNYKGDVFPILDNFILTHPDFSYQGAKGILAMTGMEGLFGYRTNDLKSTEYNSNFQKAKKVADTLKLNGWIFASHSYSHNQRYKTGQITEKEVRADFQKWKTEVEPIVGQTDVYIAPFGALFKQNDKREKIVTSEFGFRIHCGIGPRAYFSVEKDRVVMDRLDFDGMKLKTGQQYLKDFIDLVNFADPQRPKQ